MMATERDPHDLVPNGFYEKWDSIIDASIQAPVDSDPEERGYCPGCGSTNLRYRPGSPGVASAPSHYGGTTYVCRNCGAEFDETEGEE